MAIADFLADNMLGEELCVSMGNDAETVTYDQFWTANREYFQGIVKNVSHGVLELVIAGHGTIWINCEAIEAFWKPRFNYHQAIRATVTLRPAGGKKKS